MQQVGHVVAIRGDVVEVEAKNQNLSRHDLLTSVDDSEVSLEVYSTTPSDTL